MEDSKPRKKRVKTEAPEGFVFLRPDQVPQLPQIPEDEEFKPEDLPF